MFVFPMKLRSHSQAFTAVRTKALASLLSKTHDGEGKEVMSLHIERKEVMSLHIQRKEVMSLHIERKEVMSLHIQRKEVMSLHIQRKQVMSLVSSSRGKLLMFAALKKYIFHIENALFFFFLNESASKTEAEESKVN